MSVAGTDGYLIAYFVFRDGDHDALQQAHREALEEHTDVRSDEHFLRGSFGSIEIGTAGVPRITNLSYIEKYTYENGSEEWDLLYSPLVRYYLGEGNYHFETAEDVQTFADLVATGYEATENRPVAAFVETPNHRAVIETGRPPFTAKSLANDEYESLAWITIFTPPMVERYGRETIGTAPAWRTTELSDGAIVVVAYEDPHDPTPDTYPTVADYIGLDTY